jgi:hypothetical protein
MTFHTNRDIYEAETVTKYQAYVEKLNAPILDQSVYDTCGLRISLRGFSWAQTLLASNNFHISQF